MIKTDCSFQLNTNLKMMEQYLEEEEEEEEEEEGKITF